MSDQSRSRSGIHEPFMIARRSLSFHPMAPTDPTVTATCVSFGFFSRKLTAKRDARKQRMVSERAAVTQLKTVLCDVLLCLFEPNGRAGAPSDSSPQRPRTLAPRRPDMSRSRTRQRKSLSRDPNNSSPRAQANKTQSAPIHHTPLYGIRYVPRNLREERTEQLTRGEGTTITTG